MFLLQAAMAFGLVVMIIYGAFILIGIPLLANIFIGLLGRRKIVQNKRTKIIIWFEGLLIATSIMAVFLYLIWEYFLSGVLTYS
jgi:hypothetical protein